MTRTITPAVRRELETADSPAGLLAFLTISHPGLVDPITVVSDVMDYQVGATLYRGVVFGFRLLTDGETGARTQIVVQAVDRRITQALLSVEDRAKVTLELRSTTDFDLTQDPRIEVAATAPVYAFRNFEMMNVTGDAAQISADVEIADFTTEPWPSIRATQDRLPGLFR
jgi:hypothetical protein